MLEEEEQEESELETESELSENPSEQNDVVDLKQEDIGVNLKTPDE